MRYTLYHTRDSERKAELAEASLQQTHNYLAVLASCKAHRLRWSGGCSSQHSRFLGAHQATASVGIPLPVSHRLLGSPLSSESAAARIKSGYRTDAISYLAPHASSPTPPARNGLREAWRRPTLLAPALATASPYLSALVDSSKRSCSRFLCFLRPTDLIRQLLAVFSTQPRHSSSAPASKDLRRFRLPAAADYLSSISVIYSPAAMSATIQPVLPAAVGYAVVLGVGLGFAAMLAGLMWLQNRYSDIKSDNTAEFACKYISWI